MLQHELKPAPGSRHAKKRIGRGNASGHGTYATKGLKGQKARTGNDLRIGFEGGQMALSARLARKRGFTNKWRTGYEWVNVGQLARAAESGVVTPESLASAGVVRRPHMPVKILGEGEIGTAVTVRAHAFTASAKSKIEAAGGRVEQLPGRALDRAERIAAANTSSPEEPEPEAAPAEQEPQTGDEPEA
jgi:large subunit ribosomal protein L15